MCIYAGLSDMTSRRSVILDVRLHPPRLTAFSRTDPQTRVGCSMYMDVWKTCNSLRCA